MQVFVVMRIKLNNKTFMLMDAPPEKEDCVPFVTIDEFLMPMAYVFHIVAKDLENGFAARRFWRCAVIKSAE